MATESIPGPAYTVADAGDSKAKTRKCNGRKGHITSRYLRPKIGSCHDRCKDCVEDEPLELKRPARRLGVRKMRVKKNKVKRIVEPVERKKTAKTKPKPSTDPKICAREEPTNRKSTQNELKLPKVNVKAKPSSSSSVCNGQKNKKEIKNVKNTGSVGKARGSHKRESPPKDEESMDKTELIKQLLAEKITEMTLEEAENEEMESVNQTVEAISMTKLNQLIDEKITEKTLHEAENAPTVETIKSPLKDEHSMDKTELKQLVAEKLTEMTLQEAENETVESPPTATTESTEDKENGESKVKFMRGKVVEVESEDDDPTRLKFRRGKILDDDEDDGPTRLKFRRGKILDNEDDGPTRLKFREGETLEDDEDDGPTRLNFRRGTILEDEEDDQSNAVINFKKTVVGEAIDDGKKESETVTLKHQETQEKKEEELLNRVIEETASKLEIDRKTKVEALVGAFETVISLQDDEPSSQSQ